MDMAKWQVRGIGPLCLRSTAFNRISIQDAIFPRTALPLGTNVRLMHRHSDIHLAHHGVMKSLPIPFGGGGGPDVAMQPFPALHEVRAQLARIIESPDFPASERNRRFLQLVVENTLAGKKTPGHEVAVGILGRSESFCAKKDPIVRVEAAKLRRDLETYYLKSGRHDPVFIAMPKGRYFVTCSYNNSSQQAEESDRSQVLILRAALAGLAGDTDQAQAAWRTLQCEVPSFSLNPVAHLALNSISGQDEVVRRLVLEGLLRAAAPVRAVGQPSERGEVAAV